MKIDELHKTNDIIKIKELILKTEILKESQKQQI